MSNRRSILERMESAVAVHMIIGRFEAFRAVRLHAEEGKESRERAA